VKRDVGEGLVSAYELSRSLASAVLSLGSLLTLLEGGDGDGESPDVSQDCR
jgi:hypothetical protein